MRESRGVISLLAVLQALLLTGSVLTTLLGGQIGAMLAPDVAFATAPITTFIIGTAITAFPASLFMGRMGRKAGFMLGCVIGFVGAAISAVALYRQSFGLFLLGTCLTGSHAAFGQYYRLAAAEAVPDNFRGKAISYVLGGGIAGGFLGPWAAAATKDALPVAFAGPYVVLMLCTVVAFLLLAYAHLAPPRTNADVVEEPPRPFADIIFQPLFVAAVVGAVAGYVVMNFLMTATPLAMAHHHHGDHEAAFVIQWHVIAMFAPSFVTGTIIQRLGTIPVMAIGALLLLVTVGVAHAGTSVLFFWMALVFLGVGWNFLYVGGSTLLVATHRRSESGKVQGLNDMLVFAGMGTSSLLSGALLYQLGWQNMALATLPLIAATLAVLAWAFTKAQAQAPAHAR